MRETIQNANGKQFHAVSLSGGKDSTAMLLLMIERGMPIDMVLSADTGMEFPEMYEHLAKLDEHLFRERGIHITTLRHPKGFEYLIVAISVALRLPPMVSSDLLRMCGITLDFNNQRNTVYQMILTSHYKDGIEQVNVYLAACGCAPLKTAC